MWVTSCARDSGSDVVIEYALDPDIPPISNARLDELSGNLEIGRFELSRTHWAVKDVDLFRVLLKASPFDTISPKVFSLSDVGECDERLVSVMMPFDAQFDGAYETIKGTAEELGFRCLRADDIWDNDAIIQDIVSLIWRSRIVICDYTGKNANVFYEIGIVHTLGKDVILITQRGEDIPFDLRHLRYLSYLDNFEGRTSLSTRLKSRIETLVFGNR